MSIGRPARLLRERPERLQALPQLLQLGQLGIALAQLLLERLQLLAQEELALALLHLGLDLRLDLRAELDDLEERHPGMRLLDNVDAKFFDGSDCPLLADITDLQFADAMADEIDTWVADATAKGVLSA